MSGNRTVLITGAAGFLGSNLSIRYLSEGYNVIGVDNFITGEATNISKINNANFQFVQRNVEELMDYSFDQKIDLILHFASPASPPKYQANQIATMKANSLGAHSCVELAEKYKCRIIIASTSEVYGDPIVHPQTENYWGNVNPVGPRSMYDEAKRYSEAFLTAANRELGIDSGIIRIFNTYGPAMNPFDGRVVSSTLRSIIQNQDIEIFGNGNQTRSFCYVDDLVDGILTFSESKGVTGPINLGNPTEFTILELANIAKSLRSDYSGQIVFKDLPVDDPKQRKPDIAKAQEILNWKPQTQLSDGLRKTYNWMREAYPELVS